MSASAAAPPSVVFLLLDTTRADRLGAWGGPHPTSPHLDALAAGGVRFARHFANSHATRPSMPQLMTGRYYHQNVLRAFRPDNHPREFPFSRPDATAALLPQVLAGAGYQTLGVSAHPWVARDSAFGRPFQVLDFLEADANRGHVGAREVVDRALTLWQQRDRSRPTFLYLHLMDPHMPRVLPDGEPRFPVPGYDWRTRFRPDGEPAFGRRRRDWSRFDARDFTPDDRRHFAAVYDTLIAFMDEQLGRLFDRLDADDPGLAHTLIVVTADHGEELGDEGRIDHGDSLADAVQHVPWSVSGAGVPRGQVVERLTEHVDVLPTLLALLGVALPPGTHVDGRSQLTAAGTPCTGCAKRAAFYAWEDYRAIRRRRHLLRQNLPGSLRARCEGAEVAYVLAGDGTRSVLPGTDEPIPALRHRLAHRLAPLERAFVDTRYGPATHPVLVRSDFWQLDQAPALACVPVDEATPASAFRVPGWLATGRGLALLDGDGTGAMSASVGLPDGSYTVELAVVPIAPMPWLFGFSRWRKASFEKEQPSAFVPLGPARALEGRLHVAIPPGPAQHARIVGMRVSPEGSTARAAPAPPDDEQMRRLRTLGYVQ